MEVLDVIVASETQNSCQENPHLSQNTEDYFYSHTLQRDSVSTGQGNPKMEHCLAIFHSDREERHL